MQKKNLKKLMEPMIFFEMIKKENNMICLETQVEILSHDDIQAIILVDSKICFHDFDNKQINNTLDE
jgi:hypothetical protein